MPESSQDNPQPESLRNKVTKGFRSLGGAIRSRYQGTGQTQSSEEPLPLVDGPEISFEQHRENEKRRFENYISSEKVRDATHMKEFKLEHLLREIVGIDPEKKFYGVRYFLDKADPKRLTGVGRYYHRNDIKEGVNYIASDSIGFKPTNGGFEFDNFHLNPEGGSYQVGTGIALLSQHGLSAGFSKEEDGDVREGFYIRYSMENRDINLKYKLDGSISGISFSVARLEDPDESRTQFHIDDKLPPGRIAEAIEQGSAHISAEEIPPEERYEHIDKKLYKNDYELEASPDGDIILTRISDGVVKDKLMFAQQIDLDGLGPELFDPAYMDDPIKAPYEADRWINNPLRALGLGQWVQHDLEIVPKLSEDSKLVRV